MERMITCGCTRNVFVRDDGNATACKCGKVYTFDDPEKEAPKAGEVYRHYVTKKEYTVLGIATNTEGWGKLVIYKDADDNLFARPVNVFMGNVATLDGTIPRFTRVV